MDTNDSTTKIGIWIPLTQGQFALVDREDYGRVSTVKWHAVRPPHSHTWYAKGPRIEPTSHVRLKLHTFILPPPPGKIVDHRNGDGLDCRRSNLRIATQLQNTWNRQMNIKQPCGFKGVTFYHKFNKFRAHIQKERRGKIIGWYDTALDAAKAYDYYARLWFGEFARTNFGHPITECPAGAAIKVSSGGYRGVYHLAGRYVAKIKDGDRVKNIGSFGTAEEAARAFDKRARVLGRPLNFPDS